MTNLLITLARQLAGKFTNKDQALQQPVWFVHLHLWHRPLPFLIEGNLAIFAEQASIVNLQHPYRQRIFVLQEGSDRKHFIAQYFAFKQPEKFKGAGENPELLNQINLNGLEKLPGCILHIHYQDGIFKGQAKPEAKCCFQYQGKNRQVILGFEVQANQFKSYDRGVDPDTRKSLWGALMGAYEFDKIEDYSHELLLDKLEIY